MSAAGPGPENLARKPPTETARPPRRNLGRLGRAILWRFALFLLLVLAILATVGYYTVHREVENVQGVQRQQAGWVANQLDSWLLQLQNALTTAAQYPGLMDLPPDDAAYHLRQVMQHNPTIFTMFLVDTRLQNLGRERVRVSDGVTTSGADHTTEGWFQQALSQGNQIAPVEYDEVGLPIVTLVWIVRAGDQAAGLLVAQAQLSWAYGVLEQLGAEERGGYAYVVDEQGRPILHQDTAYVFAHQPRAEVPGIHAALQDQAPPWLYPGLNPADERVIAGYWRLEQVPWAVIAEQPVGWLLRAMMPTGVGAAAVLGVSLLSALVIGLYISRQVAWPIVRLREGARRIAAGELAYRIAPEGHNELTDLAVEFNWAAESLQSNQQRLRDWGREMEANIAERTSDLSHALQQLQQEAAAREKLLETIREMSSPVIPVAEGVIVLPIIGTLDSQRAQRVVDDLLAGIEREHARVAILDITGLAFVDTAVANTLLQAAQAAQLLGAQAILVGITPGVAETLVQLGVEPRGLRTAATLQEGLRAAHRQS